MGCGTSCSGGRVSNGEPYDARRLLSELVTVQTAIVLNEDFSAERGKLFSPTKYSGMLTANAQRLPADKEDTNLPNHTRVSESRRHSVEYTFSTSTCYGLPGYVDVGCDKGSAVDSQKLSDLSQDIEATSKRNSLPEHLIAESIAKMPIIKEAPEMGTKSKP